ncbi:GWxTD domain-containing protein [candidate division KSB1 bacterium]|nr:GWxTD domain-containing protein [candidate division KSB1 bacterium]
MKMMRIVYAIALFLLLLTGCASYTVNVATVPPREVEIYINEEYRGTTTDDGTASIDIKNVSFEEEMLIEAKSGNYRGYLTIQYKNILKSRQNVISAAKGPKKSGQSADYFTYNIVFAVPDKQEESTDLSRADDAAQAVPRVRIKEEAVMNEEELDQRFEICRYIATRQEIDAYAGLSYEGKRAFMQNFWQTRDQNPETAINEFKQAYFTRVELANKQFSSRSKEGWRTDPGRVWILYGEPDDIERFPMDFENRAYEIWSYFSIEGGVEFYFVAIRSSKDMRLVNSTARNQINDPGWERWLKFK